MKNYNSVCTVNERKHKAHTILCELKKLHPKAKIVLKYSNNWELTVAVILSAQCTDKRVNDVTAMLFKKYKYIEDYANVTQSVFERDIRPTGFYRNKAKNIIACANKIIKEHNGEIPRTMKKILTLPGIARKSANVILGNAYGIVEGIAVDTHVKRLSNKFGLTYEKDPVKIEKDLMQILPKNDWFQFTYMIIEYGRNQSPAHKALCENDPISNALKQDVLQQK